MVLQIVGMIDLNLLGQLYILYMCVYLCMCVYHVIVYIPGVYWIDICKIVPQEWDGPSL